MARRTLVILACGTAVLALIGVLWGRDLERNRLVETGDAVVVVEGRDIDFSPWNDGSVGVGIGGRLDLVAGRCVGLVGPDGSGRVIVWPPGTVVRGSSDVLRITSEGRTVRVGDDIQGGDEFGHDFTGIKEMLPRACRTAELVQVGLGS